MARSTLEFGPVPADESCQQVGTENYSSRLAREECGAYVRQLARMFPQVEATGAYFKITSNNHEAGVYLEVAVAYNSDSDEQIAAAFFVDDNCPLNWDEIAKHELELIQG